LFAGYERALEESVSGSELIACATRQPLGRGLIRGGRLNGLAILCGSRLPQARVPLHRDAERPIFVGRTARSYPKTDGRYTFNKLSSVYISGNATRDHAPDRIRVRRAARASSRRLGTGCARLAFTRSPMTRPPTAPST
jgi:electron-transferring-flavoprotein dehydrogenase